MRATPLTIALSLGIFASSTYSLMSCTSAKNIAKSRTTESPLLLTSVEKGWLRYEIYRQPAQKAMKASESPQVVLSVRVVNRADGMSPLRKRSSDLSQYNMLYEYLLNGAKEDFVISEGDRMYYPVSYAFENNYNAFPFETFLVGFPASAFEKRKKGRESRLLFTDRVFGQDTLIYRFAQ